MSSFDEPTVDVVVVGAGHNSLITAAYLAKAGLEVAVLEAKDIIGGNTVTEELTLPGWQHDSCSSAHAVIQNNPVIRDDELGLIADYGLRYVYTDPAAVLPLDEGDAVVLHRSVERTADEIARFSAKDAQRFTTLVDEWDKELRYAHRRWNTGELTDAPGDLKYEELCRRSAYDVVHEEFEHPVTRRLFLWMGFANFQPPKRPGTGLLPISILKGRLDYGWATPVGGSGALPAALAKLLLDHGGQIFTNAGVSEILASHGRADGVRTHDGRIVRARKAVVSSAHVRTMAAMFEASACPPDLVKAAENWRPGIGLFAVHAALHKDITYRLGDGSEVYSTSGGLGGPEGTLRQVEGCHSGEPEFDDPWMLLVSSTVADPDRAATGATFKILTAAPAELAGGRSWEEFGPQYAQHLLTLAGRHVQGLDSNNIAAIRHETPTSLATRSPSNIGGSCHGGEFVTADGGVVPGLQQWASSLDGLFYTGSMAHPGGSVSGWPGRNAARAVLSAVGIDPVTVMS
ncbi:NAD(P)/FAD-dependent oxidoreductase [Streptomyces sp. NPDC051219]|uniref:phytoene desaturase family protein n=1 Tax=Streptomyces sp. NPDC051219 TaxID=3155283 RepID=UPI003430E155